MSWLQTIPSGSVRMCLARYESDVVVGVLQKPLTHPVSVFDLSWTVVRSPSVYRFHITSWNLADKKNHLEPCSSAAGLFSFEADISDGRLLSVTPGPLDHGSLLSFQEKMQPYYPHKPQSQLLELAKQNAFEEAFETATILWSSLGRFYAQITPQTLLYAPENTMDWRKVVSLEADFSKSLGKVSKRLYRDLEIANRPEVRESLLDLEGTAVKRNKLMTSQKTVQKQELESNTDSLYRSIVMRSARLAHTQTSPHTPFKPQNKKKKELKEEEREIIDAGSGGFVRTAQLWSQLTPEALQIVEVQHNLRVNVTIVGNELTDPLSTQVNSIITAKVFIPGHLSTSIVSHLSYSAAQFIWKGARDQDVLNCAITNVRDRLVGAIPTVAAEFEGLAGVRKPNLVPQGSQKPQANGSAERNVRNADVLWKTWSSDNLASSMTREDFAAMMEFAMKKKPSDNDVSTLMNQVNVTAGAYSAHQKSSNFDAWSQKESTQTMYGELRFDCQRLVHPSKKSDKEKEKKASSSKSSEVDTSKNWEPCLLVVDLWSATASVYGGKAIVKANGMASELSPSELKKSLLGTFSWPPIITSPGPVADSVCFGRTTIDPLYTIKFQTAELPIIVRAAHALAVHSGIGDRTSQSNQMEHSFQLLDLAIPALISLGHPVVNSQ